MFTAPKGVPEYYEAQGIALLAVREALALPARLAGYSYIELPVFEDTALFVRGVGESTDVVAKEMYTFQDRGGRSLSLRPEGTAGVVRAVVEHGLDRGQLPVKLWYAGPFFRAERPQLGRYRQLQQVGVEAIGSEDPALDAEVISIASDGYRSLGLSQHRLEITSLGDEQCRPAYRDLLTAFLAELPLDEPTRVRARLNPLRVLDDKRPQVQHLLANAPLMVDHLCEDCATHFREVQALLDRLGIGFVRNPRLVRGLDYYTRTTFEFVHDGLGAQSGIGGGGRYDGLLASLGGPALSGIGFGLGVDRTLLACQAERLPLGRRARVDAFFVPLGQTAHAVALEQVVRARRAGLVADLAFGGRGLKGAMKAADRSGARYAVIIGERDLERHVAQVKDLVTGDQREVVIADVVTDLAERLPSIAAGGPEDEWLTPTADGEETFS